DRQGAENVAAPVQFGPVAPAKLRPPLRPMAEPFTQGGARRDVLGPRVHCERLLFYSARPQPVDEHPVSILRRRRVVNPPPTQRVGRVEIVELVQPARRAGVFRAVAHGAVSPGGDASAATSANSGWRCKKSATKEQRGTTRHPRARASVRAARTSVDPAPRPRRASGTSVWSNPTRPSRNV